MTKNVSSNETLLGIPLFSELSIEQLRKISRISRVKKASKGEILFLQDDEYQGFFVLLKGIVKIYKISKNGKECVVHIVKPLNIFADIPLFEGVKYPVSANVLEESVLLFIPKNDFIELIKKETDISFKMLAGFAKRLKSLVLQIEDLTSKEVVNRLAKYLIQELNKSGTNKLQQPFITLTIPKSIVASYLGTITETLSRTFRKLQNDGIIKVQGKKIFIKNLTKLKSLAGN